MNKHSRLIALPFVGLLTAGVLAGCDSETVVTEAEEEGAVAEALILGETVTLQNEVEEIVGPNAMTIGQEETLVVGANLFGLIEEGDDVQVTGTVVEFVTVDVESDYGITFDENEATFVIDYEEELAVVADEVVPIPE